MRYVVFVESLEGGSRIDLADTVDQGEAAQIMGGLMTGASGQGFIAGVAIQPDTPQQREPETKPAEQPQQAQRGQQQQPHQPHQPQQTQRGQRPAPPPQQV